MKTNPALDLLPGDANYVPPSLDSHDNILLFVNQVLRAQLAGKIDLEVAKFHMQLVNTALRVMKQQAPEAAKSAEIAKVAAKTVAFAGPSNSPSLAEVGAVRAKSTPPNGADRKPPQPVPASKANRVYDPYGCMPKS